MRTRGTRLVGTKKGIDEHDLQERLKDLDTITEHLLSRVTALEAKAGEGKGCACVHCVTQRADTILENACKPQPGYVVPLEDVPVGRWFLLNRAAGCKVYGKRTSVDNASSVIYFVRPDGTPDSCGRCVKVELMPEGYEPLASKPQPGDRIKLRDVPVGRWCRYEDAYSMQSLGDAWSGGMTHVLYGDIKANGWFDSNELVTLLPEDYEPGRKAQSKPKTVGAKWDRAGLVTVLVDGEARLVFNPSNAKIGYMEVPIQ